ncbi:ABC transporter ATP-binding protein, partial [Lysinibacillus sp.]
MRSVNIENVSKQFGQMYGVKDLNLEIKAGEFFTFLGPSGCGKTTTLRMIAGFYYPSKGKIFFDERDVSRLQPNKRNIGMVFQNYALFPHMTVDENIAFGLQVRKFSKAEIQYKVDRIRGQVHLAAYGNRKINELSGGQQQRVALARALVIEPDILLLDEPLSNLDAKLREETRIEIKRIQSELGVTTIYVTHDQMEAMAMSDRIMVMENGHIKQIGTPQE